jgi:hypothetical protein
MKMGAHPSCWLQTHSAPRQLVFGEGVVSQSTEPAAQRRCARHAARARAQARAAAGRSPSLSHRALVVCLVASGLGLLPGTVAEKVPLLRQLPDATQCPSDAERYRRAHAGMPAQPAHVANLGRACSTVSSPGRLATLFARCP